MKRMTILAVLAATLLAAGCFAGAGTMVGVPGLLWADDCAFALSAGGGNATNVGKATAKSFFGLVALGDCSIQAACANGQRGQITRIASVDRQVKNILGVYAEYTTIVTGD